MKRFNIIVVIALCLISCATPKKIGYLTDLDYDKYYPAQTAPEFMVQKGDVLTLNVSSEDPRLSAPFSGSATGEGTQGISCTVDKDGNIDFPVLGKIYVEGKSLAQVKETVASRISSSGYIKEPIVSVGLENFVITVLGRWGNQIIRVDGESINIFQVVAKAGGTTETSKINDLTVIRTEAGQHHAYSVNLQSTDIFNSPVFFLKQNDIVYMKPRGFTVSQTGQTMISLVNIGVSMGSMIATILLWMNLSDN